VARAQADSRPGESDETWLEIQDKEYGPSPLALHLTRAHTWEGMLEAGEAASISQLAESIGMDQSYLSKTVKLVNLSPEIQKMIMEGTEPESLTLAKLRHEIPADWKEQRRLFVDAHEKWPDFEHQKQPGNEHFGGRGVIMRPLSG